MKRQGTEICLTPLSYPDYDEANQLTREDNAALGKSFTYSYDKGGNIVSKSEYAYTTGTLGTATDTIDYAYDVTWKDELTEYDGTSIAYNEIGNPLTYGDDISYLWDGRELIGYQDAGSDNVVHMGYNADGLRTLKMVIDFGSTPWIMDYYAYTWSADGTLLGYGVNTYSHESIADVWIIYGENGDAVGFTVKDYEGVEPETYTYYYIKNAQGDVLRVVDETGATMADYTYDAWGNLTYTPDANAGANADIIEKYNPVTYRGYYYDTDLEMYYLRSRYYNPQWGRFLNADDTDLLCLEQNSIVQHNLFAYCLNNPVNTVDLNGLMAAAVGTLVTIGITNLWNPSGVAVLAGVGIVVVGGLLVLSGRNLYRYSQAKKNSAVTAAYAFMAIASAAATPPPPNKGGNGTQTSSKTLYNRNGYRIDVENPGNRVGQIHLQKDGIKYYYNVSEQSFRIGSSSGKLAPKAIQELLSDPDVVSAIVKGLKILGY